MYEETKDLITRELRQIVARDGMATAISMVEQKTARAVDGIVNTARQTLEQYPKDRKAKTLQRETDELAKLNGEHSNLLKTIARNEHGELRDGLWIEFYAPYNPDTSKTPQEVKEVYKKAHELSELLSIHGRNVLGIIADINPDTSDPTSDTPDPATFEPVATYTHPDEYPDELTDKEVERIRDYFAQAGFKVSKVAIWWQFVGWHVGAKSGYRNEENGYHLFTPVNYNPFSIALTRLTPTGGDWQTTYHH